MKSARSLHQTAQRPPHGGRLQPSERNQKFFKRPSPLQHTLPRGKTTRYAGLHATFSRVRPRNKRKVSHFSYCRPAPALGKLRVGRMTKMCSTRACMHFKGADDDCQMIGHWQCESIESSPRILVGSGKAIIVSPSGFHRLWTHTITGYGSSIATRAASALLDRMTMLGTARYRTVPNY
jgi:hypothetical protein